MIRSRTRTRKDKKIDKERDEERKRRRKKEKVRHASKGKEIWRIEIIRDWWMIRGNEA